MSASISKPRSQSSTVGGASRSPLAVLRQEVDDLLSRFRDADLERGWFSSTFAPSVDLVESDNSFEIRADIPGMDIKDIDVKVHGNTVTLSGQRETEREEKGKSFHRMERRSGSFSRTLSLSCAVNEDEVAAEYVNGVLSVKLPKCEEAKVKKVAVKGSRST